MVVMNFRKRKRIWFVLVIGLVGFISVISLSKLFSFSSEQVVSIKKGNVVNPASVETVADQNDTVPLAGSQSENPDEFFAGYRLEREKVRGQEVALLKEIMNNLDNDSQVKDQISLKLVNLMQKNSLESQTEALVKSSGIKDCAAILEGEVLTIILSQDISAEQKEAFRKTLSQATAVEEKKISLVTRKI